MLSESELLIKSAIDNNIELFNELINKKYTITSKKDYPLLSAIVLNSRYEMFETIENKFKIPDIFLFRLTELTVRKKDNILFTKLYSYLKEYQKSDVEILKIIAKYDSLEILKLVLNNYTKIPKSYNFLIFIAEDYDLLEVLSYLWSFSHLRKSFQEESPFLYKEIQKNYLEKNIKNF